MGELRQTAWAASPATRPRERCWRERCWYVRLAMSLLLACGMAVAGHAADFPALGGRIVDQADIVPPAVRATLEPKLAELEAKSGIQLVVATVKSLGGEDIAPYANQLFRHWQLGQKGRDNGVLLLVAPNERRVRIEVGYGLEGTLTDAIASVIIANAIAPRFKAGDFGGGISRGVDDIITVLTTDPSEWQKRPSLRLDSEAQRKPVHWVGVVAFFAFLVLLMVSRRFRALFFAAMVTRMGGGYGRGGFGGGLSGGMRGGGFSGGGGSSGGGGASGRW
jgi:uncharacterized protein